MAKKSRKKQNLSHDEKIQWMALWAMRNGFQLELKGECGFCRECVGILSDGVYPDYEWWGDDYERVDKNGEVWTPEDAYHKHPCVAVLGRGEKAESQLYDWLKWFEDNGFKKEVSYNSVTDPILLIMGKHINVRLVRGKT